MLYVYLFILYLIASIISEHNVVCLFILYLIASIVSEHNVVCLFIYFISNSKHSK